MGCWCVGLLACWWRAEGPFFDAFFVHFGDQSSGVMTEFDRRLLCWWQAEGPFFDAFFVHFCEQSYGVMTEFGRRFPYGFGQQGGADFELVAISRRATL